MDEFGIEGEAFAQGEAASCSFCLQSRDLRPSRFWIDEILGDGGDAAPVVEASFQQSRDILVAEVRRILDVPLRATSEARRRAGTLHLLQIRRLMLRPGNVGFGAVSVNDAL